jgi:hypothetical protein
MPAFCTTAAHVVASLSRTSDRLGALGGDAGLHFVTRAIMSLPPPVRCAGCDR